jgi:glycine/D-amino acid oxidase-like deaminating enzyme
MWLPMTDRIAIIGGGFTGTLAAINLLRHGDARLVLIERHAAACASVNRSRR